MATTTASPASYKFVGFEENDRTIMINVNQIVSLEDTSQGKKPRLEIFMVGDDKADPRYTLALTIREFFEKCRLI
ncbi:MAG: hypothetical protein AAF517_06750 [Planctomycetota bacterium]